MLESVFPSTLLQQEQFNALCVAIGARRTVWGPRTGADGHARLGKVRAEVLPRTAVPTFLPVKKLLLPQRERLWSFRDGHSCEPPEAESLAVVGVPLCDLQATWYLDQVFEADALYTARRARTLLVGMPCEPGPACRCDAKLLPVAGDLFLGGERAWALSARGLALLEASGCVERQDLPLPWPEGLGGRRPRLAAVHFDTPDGVAVCQEEGACCLSCGACSAVCPTCYCFDVLDAVAADGTVSRERAWDNCFFAEHGQIAGGHDFRPGRTERLRFRLEHKLLGFGAQRGLNSCVGCGRCRSACPVDIDLDRVAARLAGVGAP